MQGRKEGKTCIYLYTHEIVLSYENYWAIDQILAHIWQYQYKKLFCAQQSAALESRNFFQEQNGRFQKKSLVWQCKSKTLLYPMQGKGEQKWRVGWGAVFKVCDLLESYDVASLSAELFLLVDSQPTHHFCWPLPHIGYWTVSNVVTFRGVSWLKARSFTDFTSKMECVSN